MIFDSLKMSKFILGRHHFAVNVFVYFLTHRAHPFSASRQSAPPVVPNNFVINDFVNFRVPSPAQWPRDTLPKFPPSPD
jgi:hypothetical protein